MDSIARASAIKEIQRIFAAYRNAQSSDAKVLKVLTDGKLYELFVLSHMIEHLRNLGFTIAFQGSRRSPGNSASNSTLKFKASPGKIMDKDSHFEVRHPRSSTVVFRIFVDIEFTTLGHDRNGASDNSQRHELDIVATTASKGYPRFDEILLAVECKAVANFQKGIVKQALGVRREMSLLWDKQKSKLSKAGGTPSNIVPAEPPSEFFLIFIDPKGTNYAQSPETFGITLKHIPP
jgi:hypothetical protein